MNEIPAGGSVTTASTLSASIVAMTSRQSPSRTDAEPITRNPPPPQATPHQCAPRRLYAGASPAAGSRRRVLSRTPPHAHETPQTPSRHQPRGRLACERQRPQARTDVRACSRTGTDRAQRGGEKDDKGGGSCEHPPPPRSRTNDGRRRDVVQVGRGRGERGVPK